MSLDDVKALTFDTGGTILDWHTGFTNALAKAGASLGLEEDWAAIANDLRRRSLRRMVNLGKDSPPEYNLDDSHRVVLNELIAENGMEDITEKERYNIWWTAAHSFEAWPDFPAVLPKPPQKVHLRVYDDTKLQDRDRHGQTQQPKLGRGDFL